MRRRQTGLGILQIALGLTVATAMTAGALTLYSTISLRSLAGQMNNEVELVNNAISRLYASKNNYAGLHEDILIASGNLPASMINGSSISHSGGILSGGLVRARPISVGCSGCNDGYYIYFYEVNPEVCDSFLTSARPPSFYQVRVTGYPDPEALHPLPVSPSQAEAACGNRATPDILFYIDPSRG